MSPNDRFDSPREARVVRLVASVHEEIDRLIEASPLSPDEVAHHIRETLVRLAVRWDSLHDPKDWLLETLAWGLRGEDQGRPDDADRDDGAEGMPAPSEETDRD